MLALMFIPMSGSQTTVQYDPWADMNDDGKIDMKDIIYEIRLFGTTGDPTKNVNVTNWPTQQPEPSWKVELVTINLTWYQDGSQGSSYSNWIRCNGFSRFFIYVIIEAVSHANESDWTTFCLDSIDWSVGNNTWGRTQFSSEAFYWKECPPSPLNFTVLGVHTQPCVPAMAPWVMPPEIEVRAPYCLPLFRKLSSTCSSGWVILKVYVYLRNE
jgi:hypothetical protein